MDRVVLTGSTAFIRQENEWMKKEREFIEKWCIGRLLVKLQRYVYDRNVYQDFSVKTLAKYGSKVVNNFITGFL